MLFPISSDAPLYHRPVGTVGLIVMNTLVFVATFSDPENVLQWALPHGEGVTPLQWVTSLFLHENFAHLFSNMIFLWGFGLIVEGKIGWEKFLAVYLGIGMSECFLEQILFLNSEAGVSLGASSAIYGLMAMCLIWAPKNDLTLMFWVFLRPFMFELSVINFSLLMLLQSVVFAVILPSGGSEFLHLLGAAVGAVAGLVMLKMRLVDCEGWDLISVITGRTPSRLDTLSEASQGAFRRRHSNGKSRQKKRSFARDKSTLRPPSQERVMSSLQNGKPLVAYNEYLRSRHLDPQFRVSNEVLFALAQGLRSFHRWSDCVSLYQQVLEENPSHQLALLDIAEVMVTGYQRPRAAQRFLNDCHFEELCPQDQARYQKVEVAIQKLSQSGIIELDDR